MQNAFTNLFNGQSMEQISAFLQQKAMENNVIYMPPNRPISIQLASPTNSNSTSQASSSSTNSLKRVGCEMGNEVDFKRIREDCGDEENGMIVANRSFGLPKAPELVTPDTLFQLVPGRLSLLSAATKYEMTVGEILRRLGGPENLNTSVLAAILRRAKAKNGGRDLRMCLNQFGIILPVNKRKSTQITLFTSMVEGECHHLAKDFDFLCNTEFPSKALATVSVQKKCKPDAENIRKRREEVQSTLKVLNELVGLMTTPPSDISIQKPMENFQLVTHTFGTPALLTAFETFNKYLTAQLEVLTPKPLRPVQQMPAVMMAPPPPNQLTLEALLQLCRENNSM